MLAPNLQDLQKAVDWILHSNSFFKLSNSWELPNEFSEGIVHDRLNEGLIEIAEKLRSHPTRLGRLFERLVILIFECNSNYEVLEKGVGIFEGKNQKTELDLLLKTPNGKGLHLEVAVKFYLMMEKDGEEQIVGPNELDVLEHRLGRFELQISEGKKYVEERYPELDFEHKIFSRGRLFLPEGKDRTRHPLIDPQVELGRWMMGDGADEKRCMGERWQWICWPPEVLVDSAHIEDEDLHIYIADDPFPHQIIRRN